MSWDTAQETMQKGGSGGMFIKIEPGKSVKGVFRGEPYCFFQRYQDKNEYADPAPDRTSRFRIAFVTKEDDEYVGKIFSGGYFVFLDLMSSKNKYGLDTVFEIGRTGEGKKSRYTIMYDGTLEGTALAKISAVELPPLSRGRGRKDYDESDPPPHTDDDRYESPEGNDDIPF